MYSVSSTFSLIYYTIILCVNSCDLWLIILSTNTHDLHPDYKNSIETGFNPFNKKKTCLLALAETYIKNICF
jgi:hypothetical protein